MAGKSLVDGVGQVLHPVRKDLGKRVDRVKKDWAASGEVAAKARSKRQRHSLPMEDPDREFRL
jgi:hypothetical protein